MINDLKDIFNKWYNEEYNCDISVDALWRAFSAGFDHGQKLKSFDKISNYMLEIKKQINKQKPLVPKNCIIREDQDPRTSTRRA